MTYVPSEIKWKKRRRLPEIGNFIKRELARKGWAQCDLAYVVGCTEQTISNIVVGKTGLSTTKIIAFSIALGVDIGTLIEMQVRYELSQAKEPNKEMKERIKQVEEFYNYG